MSGDGPETAAAAIRGGVRVTRRLDGGERYLRLEVGAGPGLGWRLDKYLAAACGRISRTLLQTWLARGCGRVDGAPADARHAVRAGEVIELRVPLPAERRAPDAGEPRVLHADPGFLVADKPPGQLTHQTGRVLAGTLLDRLRERAAADGADPAAVRLVNRLDRDTAGIVVAGLRDPEHGRLCADLRAGRFIKRYRAVTVGVPSPSAGHWRQAIGPGAPGSVARAVADDGRPCHTEYRVLATDAAARYALLAIRLHTGRQHQIRVHAATNGCPLLGDWVYGEPCLELDGQWLHACELSFPHPRHGTAVTVTSPPPPAFAVLWRRLRAGGAPTPRERSAAERSRLRPRPAGPRFPLPAWLSREERRAVERELDDAR